MSKDAQVKALKACAAKLSKGSAATNKTEKLRILRSAFEDLLAVLCSLSGTGTGKLPKVKCKTGR